MLCRAGRLFGLGGDELAGQLRSTEGELKVLLEHGYGGIRWRQRAARCRRSDKLEALMIAILAELPTYLTPPSVLAVGPNYTLVNILVVAGLAVAGAVAAFSVRSKK
jgi:hypothetical protein